MKPITFTHSKMPSGRINGCRFHEGTFVTSDEATVARLKSHSSFGVHMFAFEEGSESVKASIAPAQTSVANVPLTREQLMTQLEALDAKEKAEANVLVEGFTPCDKSEWSYQQLCDEAKERSYDMGHLSKKKADLTRFIDEYDRREYITLKRQENE